jgi:hypothetical protein
MDVDGHHPSGEARQNDPRQRFVVSTKSRVRPGEKG